jgi:hypothetical protein
VVTDGLQSNHPTPVPILAQNTVQTIDSARTTCSALSQVIAEAPASILARPIATSPICKSSPQLTTLTGRHTLLSTPLAGHAWGGTTSVPPLPLQTTANLATSQTQLLQPIGQKINTLLCGVARRKSSSRSLAYLVQLHPDVQLTIIQQRAMHLKYCNYCGQLCSQTWQGNKCPSPTGSCTMHTNAAPLLQPAGCPQRHQKLEPALDLRGLHGHQAPLATATVVTKGRCCMWLEKETTDPHVLHTSVHRVVQDGWHTNVACCPLLILHALS